MVLHFLTISEQNNNTWLPQSIGALGVATIFEKMNGILGFVEVRGGRLGFAGMKRVLRAGRVVFDTEARRKTEKWGTEKMRAAKEKELATDET